MVHQQRYRPSIVPAYYITITLRHNRQDKHLEIVFKKSHISGIEQKYKMTKIGKLFTSTAIV
jgi:hypothetical protein